MRAATIRETLEAHYLEMAEEIWPSAPVSCLVIAPGERAWFVLQTVLRGEEKVREALKAHGFETYVPKMRKEIWHGRNRKLVVKEFLLFNRYLFARLPTNTRLWGDIHSIEEFDCALGSGGIPTPVRESEITRFMASEAALEFDDTQEAKIKRKEIGRTKKETTAMRFKPGSRVRAHSGPFGGYSGLVTNVTGRGAVEAMLTIFGRLTRVEFDIETVEIV